MVKPTRFRPAVIIGAAAMMLSCGFTARALAQGSTALEQQMQNELTQVQQQLDQLRAENAREEAKAKQKNIPMPATVSKLRQAGTYLTYADRSLKQLPAHYEGNKEAAEKDMHQAWLDIERCEAIDWKLAEAGH